MEEMENMERLTERTSDGILVKEDYGEDVLKTLYSCYGAEPNPHYSNCEEGYCAMEKLAEYEDLEEQCVKENSWCLKMLLHKWKEFLDDIHEFYEYRKLEKQGKLLKLPVAVGDTVYAFDMAKVIELKVIEISLFLLGEKVVINVKCQNTDCFRNFVKEEFGKTVFLTLEEAEAALSELQR